MTELILKLLGTGLSLWESKEKRKYLDKYIRLKREYYEEVNSERPNMANLDFLTHELSLLATAFSSQAFKSDTVSE